MYSAKLLSGLNLQSLPAKFVRLSEKLLEDQLIGMPSFANCIISAIDKKTNVREVSYFVPLGVLFDKEKMPLLFQPYYEFELLFFTAHSWNIPIYDLINADILHLTDQNQVTNSIRIIIKELDFVRSYSKEITNAALNAINFLIFRELEVSQPDILIQFRNLLSDNRLLTTLKYIHANIFDDLEFESVATELGVCNGYLGQYFKRVMGIPLLNYASQCKVRIGLELLISSDLPINVISDKIGFIDQSYFNRKFKQSFHLNPRHYRSQYYKLRA
ncbi:MAG: AraC family transcriptional regulator [Bacteroidota bacterium]|nr:AraC family transcriptional regulator [Bacteroidota bacterium]